MKILLLWGVTEKLNIGNHLQSLSIIFMIVPLLFGLIVIPLRSPPVGSSRVNVNVSLPSTSRSLSMITVVHTFGIPGCIRMERLRSGV